VKTLTVLLGLPAALVAGVIVFFTYGEVAAFVILGAWLILLFISVGGSSPRSRRPKARSTLPMRRPWRAPNRA